MKFEDFWKKIQKEDGKLKLKTRARGQDFTVSYDSHYDEVVVVPESTKMPRHIVRKDFEKVWSKFKEIEGDPYRPGYYQRDTHNASYILAIMEHFLKGGKAD